MLTTLLFSVPMLVGDPVVTWEAPTCYVEGAPFQVSVTIEIPAEGGPVASWLLTPAAFTLDGKPVTQRKGREVIELAPGTKLDLSYDLGPAIQSSKAFDGDFELGFAKEYLDSDPIPVKVYKAAPKGLDFMKMSAEELTRYRVLMQTNRGDMLMEFWPLVAPGHVRNFLDLCYNKFYDGLTFHRVIPGFMIQGGDPKGDGTGNGPRMLEAEFNTDPKHQHVPGVLSMARSSDPNSASCQFFVMHGAATHLDGNYTAFGKLIEGLDVVDEIVSTPRGARDKPTTKQEIKKATVIEAD